MAGVKACCVIMYICPRCCCGLAGSREARYAIMLLRDKDRIKMSDSLTNAVAVLDRHGLSHDVMFLVKLRHLCMILRLLSHLYHARHERHHSSIIHVWSKS